MSIIPSSSTQWHSRSREFEPPYLHYHTQETGFTEGCSGSPVTPRERFSAVVAYASSVPGVHR